MRFLRLLAVLSLFLFVAGTRRGVAQAAPTATGPGTSITLGGGYSIYHLQYGERYLGGAQGWVDANLFEHYGIEAEARRLRQNQDLQTHADTYMVGPRYSFHPHGYDMAPYLKMLVGVGKFSYPYGYAHGSYFVASGGGGVDLHVGNRIQFRLFDVEYQKWPQFTFGSMSSFGISTGFSIRLYRGPSWMSD